MWCEILVFGQKSISALHTVIYELKNGEITKKQSKLPIDSTLLGGKSEMADFSHYIWDNHVTTSNIATFFWFHITVLL